jgi:uncharacterized membrane protein YphA (DoxX/SURF4 family)
MLGDSTPFESPPPIVGIIPLRIGAGALLLYMHAWNGTALAWQHVWNQQPWDLMATMAQAGFSPLMGKIFGTAAAVVAAFTAVSWILGFVTRFSSVVFMPVALGALWVCNKSDLPYRAEAAVLYFLVAVTLLVKGSGWLAVDTLFRMRQDRKKSDSLFL